MIIELRGVEFVNKGAELMLQAIMQQVRKRFPNAIIAMESTKRAKAEKLAEHKIFTIKGKRAAALPRFIRRRLRFVLKKEITVIMDGSGFAFGDQWGPEYANKRLGHTIVAWRQQGKKVILLPQAFGPFSDPDLKKVMSKIISNADLVFAREERSYQHLKSISDSDCIKKSPDFTNLIKGKVPSDFDAQGMQVAIIPNRKMIDKTGTAGTNYIQFLHTAINKVISLELKPYFLIHEGVKDLELATEVNALLPKPIPIIMDADPIAIKGIISTAYFIICSRFHGVVSALSQGVPSISTSWSHKYEMLHEEYGFEEGVIKDISSNQEIEGKITAIADPVKNKQIADTLIQNSALQKQRSLQMWEQVFERILQKEPAVSA